MQACVEGGVTLPERLSRVKGRLLSMSNRRAQPNAARCFVVMVCLSNCAITDQGHFALLESTSFIQRGSTGQFPRQLRPCSGQPRLIVGLSV